MYDNGVFSGSTVAFNLIPYDGIMGPKSKTYSLKVKLNGWTINDKLNIPAQLTE